MFITKFHSEKTFNSIEDWLKELRSIASPDIKIFLIGNKVDKEER